MGIKIRYLAPAAAGTAFTYSVERRADKAFFDFELAVFRPLGDIPTRAVTRPLVYDDGAAAANFDHVEDGKVYIIRVHHVGVGSKIIAKLPVTAWDGEGPVSMSKGEPNVKPTFRKGKKFVNNQTIEAKHRLTLYGNDENTIYTATLWADGTTSCNCPGWRFRRACKHAERAQSLTADIDETGTLPGKPASAAAEEPSRGTSPFRRRVRSVDT